MNKKNGSFRNSNFFLIGVFLYAFVFWVTKENFAHVFGLFLVGLTCCVMYRLGLGKEESKKFPHQTKDLIYLSIGFCFNSLIGGFPLSLLKSFFGS
jgi:hypothetical protein